jgi:hypothetical protein
MPPGIGGIEHLRLVPPHPPAPPGKPIGNFGRDHGHGA